jgi:hypothetical protein
LDFIARARAKDHVGAELQMLRAKAYVGAELQMLRAKASFLRKPINL